MDLTWLDTSRMQTRDINGALSVAEAARAVDAPYALGFRFTQYATRLRSGWDGEAPQVALCRNERGRVVGLVEVWLPQYDNTHIGTVNPFVDPAFRRQGLGRRLFELGVERCREAGRRVLLSDGYDAPAPNGFATAMGMAQAFVSVDRRQHLTTADWTRLDKEYADAEARAAGYELVHIAGFTPGEMLADVARMTEAINDAPTDELDVEDEVFTPERVRNFEQSQANRGRRLYRLIARHKETGELAGHTVVGVEDERPWHAQQYDTSVVRTHRGHRLGLLLKIGMLRFLADREPQIRFIDTGNAASNAHMIGVNELLGYEVIGRSIEWQRQM